MKIHEGLLAQGRNALGEKKKGETGPKVIFFILFKGQMTKLTWFAGRSATTPCCCCQ